MFDCRASYSVLRSLGEERGATTVEYALVLVLVALAVAVASPNVRSVIVSVFAVMSSLLGVGS